MTRNVETSLVLHRFVSELRGMKGSLQLLLALVVSLATMIVILSASLIMSLFYGLHLVFFGSGAFAWRTRAVLLVLAGVTWLAIR